MDASTSPTGVYPELKVHIDGEWIGRGNRRTHRVLNPATGQTLAELPLVDADDLDRALSAADESFKLWRKASNPTRQKNRIMSAPKIPNRFPMTIRICVMKNSLILASFMASSLRDSA